MACRAILGTLFLKDLAYSKTSLAKSKLKACRFQEEQRDPTNFLPV